MAKIVILGTTPYRVLRRDRNSVRLRPVDAEYPHTTIFRLPGETKWVHSPHGSDRGQPANWYRQIDADTFEKISSGRW